MLRLVLEAVTIDGEDRVRLTFVAPVDAESVSIVSEGKYTSSRDREEAIRFTRTAALV